MTYIDIINNLLKRLRERTVETVSQTEYSRLLSILVNDAKEIVESSWNWSALRTTITATTTSGTFNYELNGLQNRFTLLDAFNDTDDFFLTYKEAKDFTRFLLTANPSTGSPYYYSFNGVSSDGDTQVEVYPIPDGVYTIRFNVVKRTADLTNDSDTLTVPALPVLLLAYAMAVEERGEDGGIASSSAYQKANVAVSDAISLDSDKHPEELIWGVV